MKENDVGKVGRGAIYCPDEVETLVFHWGRINLLSEPKLTGARRMTCLLYTSPSPRD